MIAKKRKNLNKNIWKKYFTKICIKSLIVWNNFFIRIAVLLYLDSNLEKQFYLIKIILLIDERILGVLLLLIIFFAFLFYVLSK